MSKKTVSITVGSALLALGGMTASPALFAASELPQGYMVAEAHGDKSGEAKCGEAKCGEKSGEAKCGEKSGEAKCGEGKCGEKSGG
ncbi:HvfA family oxazolone/thioamide-modified RiPP metallophore [Polycyclovorans algicola]|uniref:HvfA family oxazolone/thioamide-modified RiPP metallophore n=1 Tax=Polycyclovorans algicola TaxID=616992 RepID=UPI0004A748B2|nr:hypothetical protein [Polycyclovorans algicola]